jgi:hypothetical protein
LQKEIKVEGIKDKLSDIILIGSRLGRNSLLPPPRGSLMQKHQIGLIPNNKIPRKIPTMFKYLE